MEGGRRERCINMGFGSNGAVVSLWSALFFCFFLLFNFVSVGGKNGGGKLTHWTPYHLPSMIERSGRSVRRGREEGARAKMLVLVPT